MPAEGGTETEKREHSGPKARYSLFWQREGDREAWADGIPMEEPQSTPMWGNGGAGVATGEGVTSEGDCSGHVTLQVRAANAPAPHKANPHNSDCNLTTVTNGAKGSTNQAKP